MPDAATSGHGRESKGRGRKSAVVTSLIELDKFRKGNVSFTEDGKSGHNRQRAADCQSDEADMKGRIEQPKCMVCNNSCSGYHGSWTPLPEEAKRSPKRKTWGTCCGDCDRIVKASRQSFLADLIGK